MDTTSPEDLQRMSQYLTTEHFTLQGARNGTISEANGRLGSYLSTVGSSIVALAFVAEVAELGPLFVAFSSVIFPILIFLGVTTLIRLTQLGMTDARLMQAINRIRHFYVTTVPDTEEYFSFPHYDDPPSILDTLLPFQSRFQSMAAAAGPVSLINSVLAGAFASILAAATGWIGLMPGVGLGLAVTVLAINLHRRYVNSYRRDARRRMEVRFPMAEQ